MAAVTFTRAELSKILQVFEEKQPVNHWIDFFNSVLDQYHADILNVDYNPQDYPYDYNIVIEFLTELDEFLFKLTWI